MKELEGFSWAVLGKAVKGEMTGFLRSLLSLACPELFLPFITMGERRWRFEFIFFPSNEDMMDHELNKMSMTPFIFRETWYELPTF